MLPRSLYTYRLACASNASTQSYTHIQQSAANLKPIACLNHDQGCIGGNMRRTKHTLGEEGGEALDIGSRGCCRSTTPAAARARCTGGTRSAAEVGGMVIVVDVRR